MYSSNGSKQDKPKKPFEELFGGLKWLSVIAAVASFMLPHYIAGYLKFLSVVFLWGSLIWYPPLRMTGYSWLKGWILMLGGLSFFQWGGSLPMGMMGYLVFVLGSTVLARMIRGNGNDIFNSYNESFPQFEKLLNNEYSFNLPAKYYNRGQLRKSWINIINPFRGTLVIGSPGSGKTYFVIEHIIKQHLRKGFAMFIYDFKFDDLSVIAYNEYLRSGSRYDFSVICFDDLEISARCNPLDPLLLENVMDAAESARTILFGLNPDWIKKQDFWVESAINLLTSAIHFLRRLDNGEYCTLPHVIELMQLPYRDLFALLQEEPEIEALINPFISAYESGAITQLEGQMAGVTISLAKLSSPSLYYILSGNDTSLDINNIERPKILCLANNPQRSLVYGAVVSLYVTSMTRLLNRKGGHKTSLIIDEFPSIYFNGIDKLMATARSNKIATTLAVQDIAQLKALYGNERAEVITSITGNIICGQTTGDTAKQLSEWFGKIVQQKRSVNTNDNEQSVTHSTALDLAIPPSRIAKLSSGEFVGMVADDASYHIPLKMFHCKIMNDHRALAKEKLSYRSLPEHAGVTAGLIESNYLNIKKDIKRLVWKHKALR
jgi:hypothetical protein